MIHCDEICHYTWVNTLRESELFCAMMMFCDTRRDEVISAGTGTYSIEVNTVQWNTLLGFVLWEWEDPV